MSNFPYYLPTPEGVPPTLIAEVDKVVWTAQASRCAFKLPLLTNATGPYDRGCVCRLLVSPVLFTQLLF
jgi:hypothetical protein